MIRSVEATIDGRPMMFPARDLNWEPVLPIGATDLNVREVRFRLIAEEDNLFDGCIANIQFVSATDGAHHLLFGLPAEAMAAYIPALEALSTVLANCDEIAIGRAVRFPFRASKRDGLGGLEDFEIVDRSSFATACRVARTPRLGMKSIEAAKVTWSRAPGKVAFQYEGARPHDRALHQHWELGWLNNRWWLESVFW